jgi:RNA polymerase sigma-70 factor (ECF subfamily)
LNTQTQQAVSDTELIYLLKIKDVTALPLLYDAYAKALYNLIFQIVSDENETEKILEFTFFHCWNSFYLFDANKSFLFTWLSLNARNTALQHKKGKTKELSLRPIVTLANANNKTVLAQLNTNHRQLLELFYYSGFSLMEIAEQQQLAYATIKTDFRAALLALRNLK